MNLRRNRRQFLKGAAAATLLAAPLPAPIQAGESRAQQENAAPTPAEALTALARARFGRHMTEEQLKSVQRGITQSLSSADTIKRTRLENSDEPDFVFFADGP
ncbi:MAG: twin-arginine translocation signal domain-containing protein [Planctomycetes bacterium]|nr:twin-arginine translocation signal domain-containing protein [Planctomycetota bacterium]